VALEVSDLGRSLAYYQNVLGLRVIRHASGSATLAAHGDDIPLVVLHERAGATPVPRRGRLGLYHFAILLPDRAALGRFVMHLAQLGIHAGMSDHLVSEAIYLHDPDGLGIEVYADRDSRTWRSDDGQLVMATEPLDVQSVVRASEGAPWTGMPAGTVIGHVHLHVGDLAEATAFYHDALGLDLVVWRYPGALFLSAGGYHHHLGVNTWAAGVAAAQEGDARLREWELVFPDVESVHAAAAHVEQQQGSHVIEHVANGSVLIHDPWNTAVRLVSA